jgi:hypothetical protein
MVIASTIHKKNIRKSGRRKIFEKGEQAVLAQNVSYNK